jgi:anti-anti-sigma factor
MEIEIRARLGRSIEIRPSGELDIATAPDLRRVIDALAEHDVDQLIIDAGGITFMDAAGLTPLIEASHAMKVIVRTPSRPVQRLLELTGTNGWMADARGTGSLL